MCKLSIVDSKNKSEASSPLSTTGYILPSFPFQNTGVLIAEHWTIKALSVDEHEPDADDNIRHRWLL
jgi:hypothetical protein